MANNEKLNIKNNNSSVTRRVIVPEAITRIGPPSPPTPPATTPIGYGRTESDATHVRLRSDLHAKETVTCLSCLKTFNTTSMLDIYEHYGETEHSTRYYGKCFYCQGKVHQYRNNKNQETLIYHSCIRSKRGEDK